MTEPEICMRSVEKECVWPLITGECCGTLTRLSVHKPSGKRRKYFPICKDHLRAVMQHSE